jgi:hypothetical protein
MNKFTRFVIAAILYIVCWIVMFLIIPSIVWIFGGSFLEVAQHPAYILFVGLILINVFLGCIFYDLFDKDFHFEP